ncbi:cytochrome P450 2U1-like [Amphiura filiformis]|uniref:cytochrome P450 2U1-like n=1 Tax=Amphiura filiformis TaxID=82378 RepID=UPI003B20CAB2
MAYMATLLFGLLSIIQNNSTTLLIGLVTFLVVCVIIKQRSTKRNGLPPSPPTYPLIGNLITVLLSFLYGERSHEMVTRLSKTYGKIFCLSFGSNVRLVYLNDLKSVSEAFKNPFLSDRTPSAAERLTGAPGIFGASGDVWHHQRRFALSVFRSFGVRSESFGDKIAIEVRQLAKKFANFDLRPFDPQEYLMCATSNVICSVIFGRRFEYDDEEFKHLLAILDTRLRLIGQGGLISAIPILRFLFYQSTQKNNEILLELLNYFTSIIDSHKLDRAQAEGSIECNDLIDLYLREIDKNQGEDSPSDFVDERHLAALIESLFLAGTETSASTLRWTLLNMVTKPEVQKRIQDEIEDVCGADRLPSYADQEKMPYTHAVILEVSRLHSITILGVPHFACQDAIIQGFRVPKGSIVISNLWGILHDPDVWKDPYEFRPERFLDDEGAVNVPMEWIPFSIGRRVCLGEKLAKMELFIFTTHLLGRFSFPKPDDVKSYDFRGRSGAVLTPTPFKICAIPKGRPTCE